MTLNKKQREHVARFGEAKFAEILAKTSLVVRSNNRLVGLDKIREPLQIFAALKASGFEAGEHFSPGPKVELDQGMQAICIEVAALAVKSAKKRKSKAA